MVFYSCLCLCFLSKIVTFKDQHTENMLAMKIHQQNNQRKKVQKNRIWPKMSIDLKRSRKKMCCTLLLTNSNCSIHAQLDTKPNDDFSVNDIDWFLRGRQQLLDDNVFIYVSVSLFVSFSILFIFYASIRHFSK